MVSGAHSLSLPMPPRPSGDKGPVLLGRSRGAQASVSGQKKAVDGVFRLSPTNNRRLPSIDQTPTPQNYDWAPATFWPPTPSPAATNPFMQAVNTVTEGPNIAAAAAYGVAVAEQMAYMYQHCQQQVFGFPQENGMVNAMPGQGNVVFQGFDNTGGQCVIPERSNSDSSDLAAQQNQASMQGMWLSNATSMNQATDVSKAPEASALSGLVKGPTQSAGSVLHDGTGKCHPCAWYWKPKGCASSSECSYCHSCTEGELKRRKKAKISAMRAAEAAAKQQQQN